MLWGDAARVFAGSVALRADDDRGAAAFIDGLGAIDMLVNNASILRTALFLQTNDAIWCETFAIQSMAPLVTTGRSLPGMLAHRRDAIIDMTSWVGEKGGPNHAAPANPPSPA